MCLASERAIFEPWRARTTKPTLKENGDDTETH
jgi:hypothetical protein